MHTIIISDKPYSRLFFHTKATQQRTGARQQTQRYCDQISNLINNFLPGCRDVHNILHARVPIIKYTQELIGLECDLSFATTGYHMSELLYMYGELDNRVRPLVFTIRRWAQEQDLVLDQRPTPYFTNFMLTLMTIFFLQNHYKMLPPFNELIQLGDSRKDKAVCEDGIVCSFIRDISGLQPKLNSHWKWQPNVNISNSLYHSVGVSQESVIPMSLRQMLTDFFKFYAQFDYQKGSICIRTGQIQPKINHKLAKVNHKVSSFLHIVNPLEPELNVSSNVQERAVGRFRKKCQESVIKLEKLQDPNTCELLKSKSRSKLFYVCSAEKSEHLSSGNLSASVQSILMNDVTDQTLVVQKIDTEIVKENEVEDNDTIVAESFCPLPTSNTKIKLFREPLKKMFENNSNSDHYSSSENNLYTNEEKKTKRSRTTVKGSDDNAPSPNSYDTILGKSIKEVLQSSINLPQDSASASYMNKNVTKKSWKHKNSSNIENFFKSKR